MDQLLASAIDSDICRQHCCQSPFYRLACQKAHWIGDPPSGLQHGDWCNG
jgi:hypothetical protein